MRAFRTVHAEPSAVFERPFYRVNFWELAPEGAWLLDAYVLVDILDVDQALRWADDHAAGRRFELFVEASAVGESNFTAPRTVDLFRLFGTNPNEEAAIPVTIAAGPCE